MTAHDRPSLAEQIADWDRLWAEEVAERNAEWWS
jgi:hypothetical protein